MKDFSENELWYMAGLLEGEGYFAALTNNYNVRYISIKLKMTDKDIVDWVADKWGCNIYTTEFANHHKTAYTVQLRRKEECIRFLKGILPMMGLRRSERIKEILREFDLETGKKTCE